MTNEERKAMLLARWNAPDSKLRIRTLCQMDNVCSYYRAVTKVPLTLF